MMSFFYGGVVVVVMEYGGSTGGHSLNRIGVGGLGPGRATSFPHIFYKPYLLLTSGSPALKLSSTMANDVMVSCLLDVFDVIDCLKRLTFFFLNMNMR